MQHTCAACNQPATNTIPAYGPDLLPVCVPCYLVPPLVPGNVRTVGNGAHCQQCGKAVYGALYTDVAAGLGSAACRNCYLAAG